MIETIHNMIQDWIVNNKFAAHLFGVAGGYTALLSLLHQVPWLMGLVGSICYAIVAIYTAIDKADKRKLRKIEIKKAENGLEQSNIELEDEKKRLGK